MPNVILKKMRQHKTTVISFTAAVGIIICFKPGGTIGVGIGASLLASAITSFITFVFLDDEDYKEAAAWGLEHVYPTRGEMNKSSDLFMKKTRYLKIIAFGLRSMRDSQESEIRRILQEGGSVMIITMDPDCRNQKEHEEDERTETAGSIRELITWAENLHRENNPGKIEIKLHDHLPQNFLFLMSNRLYTGPYEYGKQSQQTLSFEYNAFGGAHEYYSTLFDKLWNDTEFCHYPDGWQQKQA